MPTSSISFLRNYFLKLKINCTKHEFREYYVIYWWEPSNKVFVKGDDRMKFWIPWNSDLYIGLKCTKHSKHPVLSGIFPVFENILYHNIFIYLIMPFHLGWIHFYHLLTPICFLLLNRNKLKAYLIIKVHQWFRVD